MLVLLPLLLLLLGAVHLWRREPSHLPASPPQVSSPEETVAALTGELEGAAGSWLVATLTPLHVDAGRQAFESRSLARRLGLEPGEPWRLSVRWEGARAEQEAAPRAAGRLGDEGPAGAEVPLRVPPAGIALGEVCVEDAQGTALHPLRVPDSSPRRPVSPLETLVSAPQGALRRGETADWILWGRPPRGEARLVGLVPLGDELFRAATGFEGAFLLRVTRVRRGDLGQPLARLERDLQGKRESGGASEAGDVEAERDRR